jgi:hypothetical protein
MFSHSINRKRNAQTEPSGLAEQSPVLRQRANACSTTKVSISSTFYLHLFCIKVLCAAFLYLQFDFVIFWRKNIDTKAACKMLMKLTSGQHPEALLMNGDYEKIPIFFGTNSYEGSFVFGSKSMMTSPVFLVLFLYYMVLLIYIVWNSLI